MKKSMIFSLINAFAFFVCAILWVLSLVLPAEFKWFNLGYGIALVCAVIGITFVFGASKRLDLMDRKAKITLAVIFWVIAVIALAFAIALPVSFVPALVCLVIAIGVVIGVFVTGGEKWDKGDNQQEGYKNYYERKAEQEKDKTEE